MDRLVIIKEAQAVLCEVQTKFLNKFRLVTVFKKSAMAKVASRRPLTTEARVWSRTNTCESCDGQSGTGTHFFSSTFHFPVIFMPPMLQTHLHLRVALNQKEK